MIVLLKNQVAEKCRVSPRTIEVWIREGRFPQPFYIGRLAAWSKADIDAWLQAVASTRETGK
ncbi:MAG: helix-turn-helix domain-containing protein [Burkholderiales bacterium]|nr:helix-turn-helix domain-containing protein [Burkholderiales bacterium]